MHRILPGICLTLLASSLAYGAERPVCSLYKRVPLPGGDDAIVYRAEADADPTRNARLVYVLPMPRFASEKGQPAVRVEPPPPEGKLWTVRLDLLLFPVVLRRHVAQAVQRSAPKGSPLTNCRVADVIPVPLEEVEVMGVVEGEPTPFAPVRLPGVTTESVVTLAAVFESEETAQSYAVGLRAGAWTPRFRLRFKFRADRTVQKGAALASDICRQVSKRLGYLKGPSSTLLPQEARMPLGVLLTRKRREALEAELTHITSGYLVGSVGSQDYLREILKDLRGTTFRSAKVPVDASFARLLAALAETSWGTDEKVPLELKKLLMESRSEREEDEHCKQEGSGGVDLGVVEFGGSASKETWRRYYEERGWRFEVAGNLVIPKSLDLHVVHAEDLLRRLEARLGFAWTQPVTVSRSLEVSLTRIVAAQEGLGPPLALEPGTFDVHYTLTRAELVLLRFYHARVTTLNVGNQRASGLLLTALNARFPGQFGRSPGDGKWLMHIKRHGHHVPAPLELRRLKVIKHGPGVTHSSLHRARIVGKRKLDVEVRCWSSPTYFDITAEVWGPRKKATRRTLTALHDGRRLRFRLAPGAVNAQVQLRIRGKWVTFAVGQPAEHSGVGLVLVSRTKVSGGEEYVYAIRDTGADK